jgi:hypothetical protein
MCWALNRPNSAVPFLDTHYEVKAVIDERPLMRCFAYCSTSQYAVQLKSLDNLQIKVGSVDQHCNPDPLVSIHQPQLELENFLKL